MRRALLPLLVVIALVGGACSGDDAVGTPAEVATIEALFDGDACTINGSEPDYEPADESGLDLLTAAPDAALTFIVTNTSGEDLTGLVNRFEPSLSPAEALGRAVSLGDVEGTMYERPEFIAGPALTDYGAEQLSIDANQMQYHYTLQPGVSTTVVYTDNGIWTCATSTGMTSLILVPPPDREGS